MFFDVARGPDVRYHGEACMSEQDEKRDFSRYTIEFDVVVSAADSEGTEFSESAVLKDISGSGASFETRNPGHYFDGQALDLTISFPMVGVVVARMTSTATVVRLIDRETADGGAPAEGVTVAVLLTSPLHMDMGGS